MNVIESIKLIREAKESNRLVVFVGAGVSKNSCIPTWQELIRRIAEKIHYTVSFINMLRMKRIA